MRGRVSLVGLIVTMAMTVVGCDFPFSRIDRPSFDNPVDPDARVPIETVIALIQAENSNPAPLVNAILDTGARYNTDVAELGFDYSSDPIDDLTGVIYLPRLERFGIYNGGGTSTLNLVGFGDHAWIAELEISGFDGTVLGTLPPLASLRKLNISGTAGSGVDFSLMYEQSLEELIATDAGIASLVDVDRLGPIRRLDIRGSSNTFPDNDFVDVLPVLADSLEEVRSRIPGTGIGFLGSLPNLSGVGFDIGGSLTDTFMAEVVGYGGITFFGAYDVSSVDPLTPFAGSVLSDLEIHLSTATAIDLTPLATTALERINLFQFSGVTGIEFLPVTVEAVEFIDTGFTDAGAELETIASSFPKLRILDVSQNAEITSLLPISENASTMARLEEVRADQDYVATPPPTSPYGVDDASPGNGIAALGVLPSLRYLSIRNSVAAYQFTVNGVDVGLSELWQASDKIDIDASFE